MLNLISREAEFFFSEDLQLLKARVTATILNSWERVFSFGTGFTLQLCPVRAANYRFKFEETGVFGNRYIGTSVAQVKVILRKERAEAV